MPGERSHSSLRSRVLPRADVAMSSTRPLRNDSSITAPTLPSMRKGEFDSSAEITLTSINSSVDEVLRRLQSIEFAQHVSDMQLGYLSTVAQLSNAHWDHETWNVSKDNITSAAEQGSAASRVPPARQGATETMMPISDGEAELIDEVKAHIAKIVSAYAMVFALLSMSMWFLLGFVLLNPALSLLLFVGSSTIHLMTYLPTAEGIRSKP